MKIFKLPGPRLLDLDSYHTAKYSIQKQNRSKSPSQPQIKKSGSFDLSYCLSNKSKQILKAYKGESLDKKLRTKSSTSQKSKKQLKNGYKQSQYKLQVQKKQLIHPQKKIFIKTENKSKFFYNQLRISLLLMCERLDRCLQLKSEQLFVQQYGQLIANYNKTQDKQNDSLLKNCINNIKNCQNKLVQSKIRSLSQKINLIQKQKSSISIELKKSKLKQQVLTQQIKKITDRNMQLSKQLKKCKQRSSTNQATQTQGLKKLETDNIANSITNENKNDKANDHVSLQIQKQFPKLIQQLRQYKERESHTQVLVAQLRRDGINVQKVYRRGLKYHKNIQDSQNSSQDQISQNYQTYIQKQNKKSQKKQVYKNQKLDNEKLTQCDADNSIIDEMDALSFNYQDKQNQLQAYTPRRCIKPKPLQQSLKNKLKLNFDCLYEYLQASYQDSGSQNKNFPTI